MRAGALIAVAGALTACQAAASGVDGAFYDGDGRAVHCALGIDTVSGNSRASLDAGLDRARDRHEILELFTHSPGKTVTADEFEHVLAGAQARGLPFVTYEELAAGTATGAGLALSLDDTDVAAWTAVRPMLARYGARVTFFVSRYAALQDGQRAALHDLAADGHVIEAHTVNHLRGPDVVEAQGLRAYLDDEVLPSIDRLRADGYPVRAFAYPFGARTDETDHAILAHVDVLRSVAFSYGGAIESPCPR
jgi:peptidoglycan/xylan/chitin deacetylase (PgdA/CDA1 family)